MSRLIDADALMEQLGIAMECRHWSNGNDTYGICYRCPNTRQTRYDDFCSYGERSNDVSL